MTLTAKNLLDLLLGCYLLVLEEVAEDHDEASSLSCPAKDVVVAVELP